jgi:hypothetical protein
LPPALLPLLLRETATLPRLECWLGCLWWGDGGRDGRRGWGRVPSEPMERRAAKGGESGRAAPASPAEHASFAPLAAPAALLPLPWPVGASAGDPVRGGEAAAAARIPLSD